MKTAILSDLHGNDVALELVLQDVQKKGAEELLIAGDFVGYYYHPEKVFALLRAWEWDAIQGNHDALFSKFISGATAGSDEYRASYGSALDSAAQLLNEEEKRILSTLPEKKDLVRDGKRILMCHGSPWSQDEYVYPDASEETFERIAALGYDYVILGNSHYPFVKRVVDCTITNAGSVGQPRDEGSNASWVLADFATGAMEIHRLRFSPETIFAEIEKNDPDNLYLKGALTRTKSTYAK